MGDRPFFSVVTATYGRGRLIEPTIASVLEQTDQDFDYLIVGDGCEDDTEAAVRSFNSPKIVWRNRAENSGNQSVPNNEAVAAARGQWICYLGHDDIWTPDHLSALRAVIEREKPDFAISGLADWGPPDSGLVKVAGIFDSSDVISWHFTPPSCVAHRREALAALGGWPDPREIVTTVDSTLFQRAYAAGLRFASTKKITVHKFASALRYLAYLDPSNEEQKELLKLLREGRAPEADAIVERAKARGEFMTLRHPEPTFEAGVLFQHLRVSRGLRLPALQELKRKAVIEHDRSFRGLDWEFEPRPPGYLTSYENPRPKLLIPYRGGAAAFSIAVRTLPVLRAGEKLGVLVNGRMAEVTIRRRFGGEYTLVFEGELKADGYTIITILIAPPAQRYAPTTHYVERGKITIGKIRLRPLSGWPGLWQKFRNAISRKQELRT